jgi:hypothetical protein
VPSPPPDLILVKFKVRLQRLLGVSTTTVSKVNSCIKNVSCLSNLILLYFCENINYVDCSIWSDWFRFAVSVRFMLKCTVSYSVNMFYWCPSTPHTKTRKLTGIFMSHWNPSEISQYITPHDLILELLDCKAVKASDHSRWFVWLPSYFLRDSLCVLKFDHCFYSTVCWREVCVLHCSNRLMLVHTVSSELYIQELSQLHRSIGRNIGFSSYYYSCVKNYGRVLFTLQLTVTRVLCGHDRDFWNSSLLASYGHACCCFNEKLKTDVSFQVDFMLCRCF